MLNTCFDSLNTLAFHYPRRASFFLSDLFVPFVEYFIKSGFSDPYSHFLETGQKEAFPYPALMLIILALSRLLQC